MNPLIVTLLVVAVVALLVLQQVVWERNMRRARANGTGIYRFSPPVRRVILIVAIIAVIVFDVLTWH